MIDLKSYKTFAEHMICVGPFSDDSKVTQNTYLIYFEKEKILVDLPTLKDLEDYMMIINQLHPIEKINYLIISHMHAYTVHALNALINKGFQGKIISNRLIANQIGLSFPWLFIEDIEYRISFGQKQVLSFLPLRFLPYPEAFMTYVPSHQTLFSGMLFSSQTKMNQSLKYENLLEEIVGYHRKMMPSSEYLKNPLKDIKKHKIKYLCPSFGQAISDLWVNRAYQDLMKIEFYNTYQVVKDVVNGQRFYNYIEIINHMLNHLLIYFSAIDILDTFVGSPYTLSTDPIELRRSSLEGYKLWNGFFEHVYVRKGIMWLAILEPIVTKYVKTYNIKKPTIYRSIVLELTMYNKTLEEEKSELEKNADHCQRLVQKTQDQITRCPITSLYNQAFYKKVLINDFSNTLEPDKTRGFLLVQLDQLESINKKYGKETGDETIRNLKYLMEQNKKEDSLLFKQNGPGIYVYENNATVETIQACALRMRNMVEDSNLFIEKVSVSVSMVMHDDLDQSLSFEKQVDQLFNTLTKGIDFAKDKGSGAIVNQKRSAEAKIYDGVVLLIDEDEINRNMIYRIFKRVNYEVIIAKDVHDALELIEKHPIDIIISEINLTKIDGFSLKQMFNETVSYKNIPFIMVSHSKTLENIKRGNTLDVDLILEKPIIPEELIGHVKRFKERKSTS